MAKKTMTIKAAADEFGVSTRTIRRYIQANRLTAYRIGPKLIRLDADEVARQLGGNVIGRCSACTDWDDQPMGEYPDLPDSAPGFQPPVERIAGDVGSPAGPPPNDPPGSAAGHPKTEAEWIEFAKHFDFDGFRRQHPTT